MIDLEGKATMYEGDIEEVVHLSVQFMALTMMEIPGTPNYPFDYQSKVSILWYL